MTDINTNWDDTATGTIGITADMEWPYYDALSAGLINDDECRGHLRPGVPAG